MTTQLELFLQGGLGNQLIQLAYADSLQVRTGSRVRINPVLLHPIWSRLRSISRRKRCWPWASTLPEAAGLPSQAMGLLRLNYSRLQKGPFTDRFSDVELLQQISASRADAWHGLLGYFQRHQALGSPAQRFWRHIKQQLLQRYSLKPFPRGQVAAHIRLGDYLWPENQRLFARYSLEQQIREAQRWSRALGGPEIIHLVTDDPLSLDRLLAHCSIGRYEVYRGGTAEDDFLFLASHRHIVGSNSTFSLCSGKLSHELWGESQSLTLPFNWYRDAAMNKQMQLELEQCAFLQLVK